MHRGSERGDTFLTAILAAALIAGGFFFFSRSMVVRSKSADQSSRKVLAEGFASELLEYFRSLSSSKLNHYIQNNGNYPLCSRVNLLDRVTGVTALPDAIADLPSSALNNLEPNSQPNRSYLIQVADWNAASPANTLVAVAAACGTSAPYDFALNSTHHYLVTVSVSWVPPGKTVLEAQNISLSTVLPESP